MGFPGAFASAAKIASGCKFENADDLVVADRIDKLDRWHAARRNGLSTEDASNAGGEGPLAFDAGVEACAGRGI